MNDLDKVQFVVVINRGSGHDRFFYVGDNEIAGLKVLKDLKHINKEMVRATVKMCKMHGYDLIQSISVVEKIA
ncbi:hypothetical protein LGL08_20675 [Clostridium estertheticum]|uniref:hypothetical protein n=1 Tax=Clostridium estertheticum TaxID=238834 RepID=UPI001CF350EC|nr:hypothetical protein [Clostridium estertheticum]MCB2308876.1 hypothetical protein [Clostridium estertheticum]MCB2347288.1 hypothetical protein [Clostridium estertheticum]MCB2351945.1 hypothetical protein [Clostridium estertheticum]WAG48490.1 hypothetical protein LL127_23505 [Clostridium estertheticum]